jgi:uncharacterized protein
MDFQARIDQDLKDAMKARQSDRLNVIRMLKSSLKLAAIEKGGAEARLDDAAAIAVVRKELKKRQDSIEQFVHGNRPELAEKERAEAAMLEAYLPTPLTQDEIAALVREAIAETGATSKAQMGIVMKAVVAKAEGRADGKAINAAVSSALS